MTGHSTLVPATVAEVIDALDVIIDRAVDTGSRSGYFAAIYRKVTAKVLEGIEAGFFDDGERMARLDVAFARRYLAALDTYERGGRPTRCWELAFQAGDSARLIVLQHLLLGINAHINLDLGVAAAQTAPGSELVSLRRDFDRVNEILALLISDIERDLSSISPWIGFLARLGGRHDDELIRFSIEVARTQAWRFAVELAPLDPAHWPGPIGARDARVARVAGDILRPGLLSLVLLVIRSREQTDVRANIRALQAVEAPSLAAVETRVRQARATP